MNEARILATCSLGLGFSYKGFQDGLEMAPHAIACDAGSSDFGPYYLGAGLVQKSRVALKRDLDILLQGARRIGVPFLTGSAGGAGADPHIEGTAEVVREIAAERSLRIRMATISAEVTQDWLRTKVREDKVRGVGSGEPLTEETVGKLPKVNIGVTVRVY